VPLITIYVNVIGLLLMYTSFFVLDLPPSIVLDPYLIHMVPRTSVAVHISQLHLIMVAHMQDPQSEFHDVLIRAHRLLWSPPFVAP